MKRISLWLFIFAFFAFAVRGQDDATQRQIDKLSGQIQDLQYLQAAQIAQTKRIEALEKAIADLRDKLNQPGANNYASADDLQKLATQVRELAKKQQADNDLILKEIERLGKTSGSTAGRKSSPGVATAPAENPTPTGGAQKGFYYEVQSGNTLLVIVKAYREQGIKVTVDQILKANPGLDPKDLPVGKKIFIPAPAQ
jgi:LysM repeat protein